MIEQRCAELELDLWYTTRFRSFQWQAIREAFIFEWGVGELRRARVPDAEQIITEKLEEWEPSILH